MHIPSIRGYLPYFQGFISKTFSNTEIKLNSIALNTFKSINSGFIGTKNYFFNRNVIFYKNVKSPAQPINQLDVLQEDLKLLAASPLSTTKLEKRYEKVMEKLENVGHSQQLISADFLKNLRQESLLVFQDLKNEFKQAETLEDKLQTLLKINSFIEKFARIPLLVSKTAISIPDNEQSLIKLEVEGFNQAMKKIIGQPDLFESIHQLMNEDSTLSVKQNEEGGINLSLKVKNKNQETIALFKLAQGESLTTGAFLSDCFSHDGGQAIREFASSFLNHINGYLTQQPLTCMIRTRDQGIGSLQIWLNGAKEMAKLGREGSSFEEEIQTHVVPDEEALNFILNEYKDQSVIPIQIGGESRELTTDELNRIAHEGFIKRDQAYAQIPMEEAQGLMAFHLLIGALDESNTANTMYRNLPYFKTKTDKQQDVPVPFSIDKGFSLPDLSQNERLSPFMWQNWPQAQKPFCDEIIEKINAIDIDQNEEALREQIDKIISLSGQSNLRLEEGSYRLLRANALLLKKAANDHIPISKIIAVLPFYLQDVRTLFQNEQKEGNSDPSLFDQACIQKLDQIFKPKRTHLLGTIKRIFAFY